MSLWENAKNGTLKVYEYTKNNLYITDEQRDFYEENGYLIFRNLVDHDLLDEYNKFKLRLFVTDAQIQLPVSDATMSPTVNLVKTKNYFKTKNYYNSIDICENKVKRSKWTVLAKNVSLKLKGATGQRLIDKIVNISYDDIFFKYLSYKPMIDIVESIIGPNICAVHNQVINKPPNSEEMVSEHPIHQDSYYFPFGPASSIVTTWTAMEHVDEKNGCLFVIPGTHKYGLKYHEYAPGDKRGGYLHIKGNEELTRREKVYLPMAKGDTAFFHPLLFHGSLPNVTKGFRRAISSQFADNGCHFVNVKGTILELLVRAMQNVTVKQGYPKPYEEYWRLKARLIRGEPGHFQHNFINPKL